MDKSGPSLEARRIIKEFTRIQKEKYGPDWKKILAAEMAAKTAPIISELLRIAQPKR